MYEFNVADATEKCIQWIRDWFSENGPDCNAIIGISGGKDSSVVAALCVAALGKKRVVGVMMPQGDQFDINYSIELCELLEIENCTINIKDAVDGIYKGIGDSFEPTLQTVQNLPARIRMATLYAVSASKNGRVANTCNLSEDYIGYATRYGDGAGDFGPISHFTVEEVCKIGLHLGLPEKFVTKPPLDGLCGRTDEENLGFTYQMLDDYIRRGIEPPIEIKEKIDHLHKINLFKLSYFPTFKYFE